MNEDATLDEFTDSVEDEESDEDTGQELFGLGKIPVDWSIESLSDSTEIIPGNSPPSSTYNESGEGLPFFQGNSNFGHFYPEADTWCSEPRKKAQAKDVLMSIRAPVGDLNIADRDCCIGRGLAALRPKTVNGLYLFYHLEGRQAWLSRLATGSTFNSVTKSDLQYLDISTPPLPEQRKIAIVLYTVDQAIQKTEEIIDQKETVKRGLMQDIFRYGLTSEGGVRQIADGEPYEDTKYGTVPKGWNIVPLNSLIPDDGPITYGIVKPGDHHPDGVPVVKVENIMDGSIDNDDLLHTDPEIHEKYKRAELQPGDLLFTIRGTVGRMAFVPDSLGGANLTQDTARIRVEDANRRFVRYYLETATPNNYFERHTKGQAVQGINLEDLREVPVHLPTEEEQNRVVEILDSHTEQIQTEREYLSQLKRLKQGLMQDLLSGEVRTHDKDIEVVDDVLQYG